LIISFPGKPQIVAPFPENIFPIEDEKAQVSCTMKDSEGATPTKILFYRKDIFGATDLIDDEGINRRRYYENITSGEFCMCAVNLWFLYFTCREERGKVYQFHSVLLEIV